MVTQMNTWLFRADKQRYARDQFKLLEKMINTYGASAAQKAIEFCESSRLLSTVYVKDYLEHNQLPQTPIPMSPIPVIPIDDPKYHVTTQKRSLDVYKEVGAKHE